MNKLSRFLFVVLLIGLPLCGVWIAGHDPATYLEFPPITKHVEHAPFSWPVFIGMTIGIFAVVLPFITMVLRNQRGVARGSFWNKKAVSPSTPPTKTKLPWWGWVSLLAGLLFWLLAWTRLDWMEPMQLYTFTPIWIAYIVLINALTYRRTGRCLLTSETGYFVKLFPLSALFWWFFEYLNRFVQNWYYVGCETFSPLQYVALATLAFSTVLPAVLSTEEWLASYPRCAAGLQKSKQKGLRASCASLWPFIASHGLKYPKLFASVFLLISSIGLFLIGRFPDYLYPLLWVAPLILLMALNSLQGRPSFFPEVGEMDLRRIYRLALAALICGLFWELWNWHSLAKWIYSVPYVHRFQLFEMPILGYAGYLPFGLECAVIAELIRKRKKSS